MLRVLSVAALLSACGGSSGGSNDGADNVPGCSIRVLGTIPGRLTSQLPNHAYGCPGLAAVYEGTATAYTMHSAQGRWVADVRIRIAGPPREGVFDGATSISSTIAYEYEGNVHWEQTENDGKPAAGYFTLTITAPGEPGPADAAGVVRHAGVHGTLTASLPLGSTDNASFDLKF